MTESKKDSEPSSTDPKPSKEKSSSPAETEESTHQGLTEIFPIVGIGASAGGLEALEQFFTHMPADSGMAFVVIVHLAPDHESMMSDILQKYTDMPTVEIEDSIKIEPNAVYVIAPDANVGVLNGTLHLFEPDMPRGRRVPVDYFFRSLADDQAERAIALVLSGTGSNGSLGLKAIKGAGGMVMVQAPETAKYDGMPRSAIATGLADYILPPAVMPTHLIEYVKDFEVKLTGGLLTGAPKNQAALQKVFILLRDQTGHDFSTYKPSTVERRLNRRMAVHQLETLSDYVQYLSKEPAEIQALFKELLIGVTNFFRDPEAFEVLKEKVLPYLIENKPPHQPLRVWTAGCSTGEEAYSIAMVIKEYLAEHNLSAKVQIFASDVDTEAIDIARLGTYPDGIGVDVSPERLNRFFTQDNSTYRINADIREMVIFAEQSVIKDAPFSRLDLISCRNLLIYLQVEMQQKILNLFHYSLRQEGILFLGTSETRVEANQQQFAAFDSQWKFFRRVGQSSATLQLQEFPSEGRAPLTISPVTERPASRQRSSESSTSLRHMAENILLTEYVPAAVVVDEHGDIAYIHRQTEPYLHPPTGEPPFNILEMAHEELHLQLRAGIHKVFQQKEAVAYERLRIISHGQEQYLNLTIRPISRHKDVPDRAIVIFRVASPPPKGVATPTEQPPDSADKLRIRELEQQLSATQEYLQTTVEELETANEDVRAANEELQATNEELQSLNEELQTSQEELHSSNEELITMNANYQDEINQLRQEHDDIHNLLVNTQLAIIFLDIELRIKDFTPSATEIVRLISSDVGRPLDDLTIRLDYDNLVKDAAQVLNTLVSKEAEVQNSDGRWYSVRLLPYRTVNNVIAGVVITAADVTPLKKVERQQVNLDFVNSIIDTLREPFVVLTSKLQVVAANRAFYQTFEVDLEETEEKLIYQLGNNQWDIPDLRRLLEQIIPRDNSFEDFEVKYDFPTIGHRVMRLNARRLLQKEGEPDLILLAIEDVTEKEDKASP